MFSSSTTPYVVRVREDDDGNDSRSIVSESVAPVPNPDALLEGMNRMITELCGNIGTVIQAQVSLSSNVTSLQSNVQGLVSRIQLIEREGRMSLNTNPEYGSILDAISASTRLTAPPLSSRLRSTVRVTPEPDAEGAPSNLRRSARLRAR